MTVIEAIEELKYDCNELGKAIPCDTSWGMLFENAYGMAIQALEKQIPKKPIPIDYEKYIDMLKSHITNIMKNIWLSLMILNMNLYQKFIPKKHVNMQQIRFTEILNRAGKELK